VKISDRYSVFFSLGKSCEASRQRNHQKERGYQHGEGCIRLSHTIVACTARIGIVSDIYTQKNITIDLACDKM
jgi:hypothetical protein